MAHAHRAVLAPASLELHARVVVRFLDAEAVIKVEMAKGGIEVVPPQEPDHPPAEPNTFGVTGGSGDLLLRFGEFVDFLRFLGGVLGGRLFRRLGILSKSRGHEPGLGRKTQRGFYDYRGDKPVPTR